MREKFNDTDEAKRKTKCLVCDKEMHLYQSSIVKGVRYFRKGKTAKFCSDHCAGISKRRDIIVSCNICGKDFLDKPHKKTPFCSDDCKVIHRKNYVYKQRTDNLICKNCESPILYNTRLRHYCSESCREQYSKNKYKATQHDRNCYTCGNSFVGHAKEVFCSEECRIPKKQRYKQISYKIKKDLIDSMGGKCNHCEKVTEVSSLCFHHIKDKLFTLDRGNLLKKTSEEIKQESEKCICLCHNCHAIEHQKLNKDSKNSKKNLSSKLKKKQLLELFGNKCIKCGWTSDIEATLSFDHLRDKKFELNVKNIKGKTDDELLDEALKCQVLCLNCHISKNILPDRKIPYD